MRNKAISSGLATTLILTLWAGALLAQSFSVDLPSPGITPADGDSIFVPGGIIVSPPPPPPIAPPPTLVAGSAAGIEVDAFSFHGPVYVPDGAILSVTPGSVGAAGGDHAADFFFAGFMSANILLLDGNGVAAPGAAPPLGLPEPSFANLDALDGTTPPPLAASLLYFSVDPGTAAGPYGGASAADVFTGAGPGYSLPGGVPPVYATAAALGLAAADDINGLHYMEDGAPGSSAGDMVYFSLAPGSPELGVLGASPADILLTSPGGAPVVAFAAALIGLLATDDLNALHMHMPGAGLPVQLKNFNVD